MFKIKARIIESPKRKILAQIPYRYEYNVGDLTQIIGWVWADAVFGKQVGRKAIFLCEFNRGEIFGWVKPAIAPKGHIVFNNDLEQWRDHSLGQPINTIPHLFVP